MKSLELWGRSILGKRLWACRKLKNMDLELNFYKSELQRAAKDRYNIENIIGQDKQS